MKTIKEAGLESANDFLLDYGGNRDEIEYWVGDVGFSSGVAWAERWVPVEEEMPEDGMLVLAMRENHGDRFYGLVRAYRGHLPTIRCSKGEGDVWHLPTHWRPVKHK